MIARAAVLPVMSHLPAERRPAMSSADPKISRSRRTLLG